MYWLAFLDETFRTEVRTFFCAKRAYFRGTENLSELTQTQPDIQYTQSQAETARVRQTRLDASVAARSNMIGLKLFIFGPGQFEQDVRHNQILIEPGKDKQIQTLQCGCDSHVSRRYVLVKGLMIFPLHTRSFSGQGKFG